MPEVNHIPDAGKLVAKCPVCGKEPIKIQFSAGGCGFRCCGEHLDLTRQLAEMRRP